MDNKNKKVSLWFLLGNYYAFLVIGVLVLMTGSVMPYILEDYQLRFEQGGTLLMLQATGNLIFGALSGIVAAYIGRRFVLIFGALSIVIGYGGAALIPSAWGIYVFLLISGFGWGALNNLVNVVVSEKTDGDPAAINILHMSFGIGAFVAPFIVSLFVGAGLNWRYAMGTAVILAIILVVVFSKMNLETHYAAGQGSNVKKQISFDFFKDARFYSFMLILFVYVGSESGINGWLTTYLIKSGYTDEFLAQKLLASVWVAMIIGRISCAWLSKYISKELLLLAGGIGSAAFILSLNGASTIPLIYLSVIGLGLSFAGIYPNTVANAGYLINGSSTASGLMFSCGGLGASFIPYVVGLRADQDGINAAMGTMVIPLILLGLLCIFNFFSAKKQTPKKAIS